MFKSHFAPRHNFTCDLIKGNSRIFAKPKQLSSGNNYCNNEDTVSVLGREEGYTVKYGLSPRAIRKAQALFYRISRLES